MLFTYVTCNIQCVHEHTIHVLHVARNYDVELNLMILCMIFTPTVKLMFISQML